MHAIRSTKRLEWGSLDVPLFGISADWNKNPVEPAAVWCLAMDSEHLWFIASHGQPAQLHPGSRPGRFMPELWRHDVAELFLADPSSGRYLEINLAPNAAWWSCEFTAPRVRASATDEPIPGVNSHAELAPDGSWVAALSIPLDLLKARIDFGANTRANVSFILNSPDQRFLTAVDLGQGEPDFHQPGRFSKLTFIDGGLSELPAKG